MYLEKPKRLIIWNGGSTLYKNNTYETTQYFNNCRKIRFLEVLTRRTFVEPFLKDPRFHQAKHALSHYYLERRNQIDRQKYGRITELAITQEEAGSTYHEPCCITKLVLSKQALGVLKTSQGNIYITWLIFLP
jgi:hypothetical protein